MPSFSHQESIQEEVEEYYSDYSLEFDEDEASGRDRTPNRYVDQSSPSKDADEDPPGYEKSPAAVVRDGGRSITSLGDRDPEERYDRHAHDCCFVLIAQ